MNITFDKIPNPRYARCYGIDAIVKNFKGCQHLEITLFRSGATAAELEEVKRLDLVGPPEPEVPPEVLQGATEEGALRYVLENFTESEAEQFLQYCQDRYADLFETILIAPLELPVPLGAGPLAALPTTPTSGFICFDQAPNYPLNFAVRAYFDFNLQDELSESQV
ncbi:MAG: hypothetical protein IJU79_02445 [Desulfovibrionaceae bacterium]|nr:hypothetical protein [Desulfovibrionaceae bacterium]